MKDPYETLGVARTASPEEIKKAYLRLAKKLHPDLNPGDTGAEERFKEVSSANDFLSDPERRRRYDAGEIDASGAERRQHRYYRDYAGAAGDRYESQSAYSDFTDDDVLAEILRRRTRGARGVDLLYRLEIGFLDAVNGAQKEIVLPQGGALQVTIPAGVEDGQVLRLRGKGAPSPGEGDAGDALIEIAIAPHRFFTREGDDIHLDLPVTITEAVLGAEVKTPTPSGKVFLKIPKQSNTGTVLRLKGRGVLRGDKRGDQLVTLKVMAPTQPEPELEAFLANWKPASPYHPRQDME